MRGSRRPAVVRAAPELCVGLAVSFLSWAVAPAFAQPADTVAGIEAERRETGVGKVAGVDDRVEEIVVSARKRDELIEDTPLAVTALGVEALRDNDITRLDQIRTLVPNLNWQLTPIGVDQATQFRIRGIGTTRGAAAFDTGVAVYLDGVYMARAVSAIMGLIDVRQIEVLRGPQGTLFGKNAIGGAISVTTVKANDMLEGFAQVRAGNFGALDARLMLNVPLRDDLFARFSVTTDDFGGFTRNTLTGNPTSDRQSEAVLGSIRWLPRDDLTIDLNGSWNRSSNHGVGGSCFFVRQGPLSPPDTSWQQDCVRSGPFDYESNILQLGVQESWGLWGVADWDAGPAWVFDALSLKSTTSWRAGDGRFRSDLDGTALPLLQLAADGGSPTDGMPTSGWSVVQELQATASAWDGRVSLVGGAFGYWERSDTPITTTALVSGSFVNSSLARTQTDNRDWALYAQGTAEVLEWLSLTAGLRYTEEKKGTDFTVQPILPNPSDPTTRSASATFSAWTPMASLALTAPPDLMGDAPLDHLLGYFTYARGFRGGGFNSVLNASLESLTPFEPETLDSFEIGAKAIVWDERVTFNLAAFLYDYRDIQVTSTEFDATTESVVQLTRNAAEGTGRGLELEIRAFPLPGLVVNGSTGLLHTHYDSFPTAVSDVDSEPLDRAGESFNNSPALQTNLGVQFTVPVLGLEPAWLSGHLTPRLDWYYQSSVHFAGPELPAATQPGYNLLHARLSYDFLGDRAQVALWARNLADETYFENGQPLASTFGLVLRTYAAPRTFGGEISYRFE